MARKTVSKKQSSNKNKVDLRKLKNLNLFLGLLLIAEGIAVAVLGNSYSLPVVSQFLTTDTLASQAAGSSVLAPGAHLLFDLNIAYALGTIAVIAGALSLLTATIWQKKYESDLKTDLNRKRWLTSWIVGGLVLLIVSLLSGVSDIALLVAIFALVEITALFSILIESHAELSKRHPRVVNKLAFVSSATPWIVIALYVLGSVIFGSGALPSYLYLAAGSIFVLTAAMAAVMYQHGNKKGKFVDTGYTEQAYIIINFLIVSALLWQVYFGVLD